MNRWRIIGLVLLAVIAAWGVMRFWWPRAPATQAPAPTITTRDQFHASRPLRVVALAPAPPGEASDQAPPHDMTWLERELRYLLGRGRMKLAGRATSPDATYTLRVEVRRPPTNQITLQLVAPDEVVERTQQVPLGDSALGTMQTLAKILPAFLGAAHVRGDWVDLLGTDDVAAFAAFVDSTNEILGVRGHGFTQPQAASESASINRLEALTRKHPKFARAWSLQALAYLDLGGKDSESLTQLAESTAERALAMDPSLSDARSALGLVSLRRGQWAVAEEQLNGALNVDPDGVAALEGLACLLMDVGRSAAALPIAQRAAALQPANIGARECLTYAQLAAGEAQSEDVDEPRLEVASVRALALLLAGRNEDASKLLHNAADAKQHASWIDPLLRAADRKRQIPQALQAVTRAANEGLIDPSLEVVCGAALRQSDFVFNRMLRLQKQDDALPLRILWLPGTAFLRKHPAFESVVSAEGLLPFWQDHGRPDVCEAEPEVFGCRLSR